MKNKLNGNLWKAVAIVLISVCMTLFGLGYNSIANRLDKIDQKLENQTAFREKLADHDARIMRNEKDISTLSTRATERIPHP